MGNGEEQANLERRIQNNLWVDYFISSLIRGKKVPRSPLEGFTLRLHYRWTCAILMCCFAVEWYRWFQASPIVCVNYDQTEYPVRLDYLNICHSYPYVELQDGAKRYLIFYRWITYTFPFLTLVYRCLRILSKNFEDPFQCTEGEVHHRQYHHRQETNNEPVAEQNSPKRKYFSKVYYWTFMWNCLALIVDILLFVWLHYWLLQNRFLGLGYHFFHSPRDSETFSDFISQTFPPFANCTLSPNNLVVGRMTQKFGCHLTLMELYEKIFIFLWFWLIVLMLSTLLYLAFWYIFMWKKCVRKCAVKWIFLEKLENFKVLEILQSLSADKIFFLFYEKDFLSSDEFAKTCKEINPDLQKANDEVKGDCEEELKLIQFDAKRDYTDVKARSIERECPISLTLDNCGG